MKRSILFIFFLLLSIFSEKHSSKTIPCMEILYKYQTTALLTDIFLFWFRAACELHVPLASYGQVCRLLCLLFTYSRCGQYSKATPGLLNACVTVCEEFLSRQLSVSRSLTLAFLFTCTWSWRPIWCHGRRHCASRYYFYFLSAIVPVFAGE